MRALFGSGRASAHPVVWLRSRLLASYCRARTDKEIGNVDRNYCYVLNVGENTNLSALKILSEQYLMFVAGDVTVLISHLAHR